MPPKQPTAKVFDLAEVVKNWAWREYDHTATSRKQKRLRAKEKNSNFSNKYLNLLIDWSDVGFRDNTYWDRLAVDDMSQSTSGTLNTSVKANGDAGLPVNGVGNATKLGVDIGTHASLKADSSKPQSTSLFQTKFTNNTAGDQDYTMKTEKTTRSTCSTEVETCLTKGAEFGITLKTPGEVFEANAGYKQELTLTNTNGETIEEELHWGVESKITVKPRHVATAELVVNENKYKGEFVIESMVRGQVYVTFLDVQDNNSLVKATGYDVASIVEEHLERERRKGEPVEFVEISEEVVYVRNKGRCKFRFGISQEVLVNQVPLPGYEHLAEA